jgi:hypothetical protein
MKRYIAWILVALNIALAILLAWMWFQPNGELKNTHWTMPRGQKTSLDDLVPNLGKAQPMDQSQFLAMLDRPLFSLSRRPPPPPPPPPAEVPPPPPDYLADAVLSGVYVGQDGKSGGVIIRFQGKDKSIPLRGALDGWTLSSVADNRVYFTRGGETKEITLQKAKLQTGYGAAAEAPLMPAAQQPKPESSAPRRGPSLGGSKSKPRQ